MPPFEVIIYFGCFFFNYEMKLSGTYDVLEMTRMKLVIQKESMGVKTVYAFRRYK